MIFYRIEHYNKAFDSLVEILETNFGIHVYEDNIAAPERAFIVSNKPLENPSEHFNQFIVETNND
jgi:hypothetical protein